MEAYLSMVAKDQVKEEVDLVGEWNLSLKKGILYELQ